MDNKLKAFIESGKSITEFLKEETVEEASAVDKLRRMQQGNYDLKKASIELRKMAIAMWQYYKKMVDYMDELQKDGASFQEIREPMRVLGQINDDINEFITEVKRMV